MDDDEELLDLVDINDQVIGTIRHADSPGLLSTKAGYVRGVGCFIQNSKGQLWTPRRTANKKIAPNGLDYGVGGHVMARESYAQALVRESEEELLLKIKENELKYLGVLSPVETNSYFFIGIFLYHKEQVVKYNANDFMGYEWLYPEQVIKLIDKGALAKSSLKSAMENFLL